MTIRLDQPLAWTSANADECALLDDLQGNILKGHGRDFTAHLFLHFEVDLRERARAYVAALAATLPSARQQLEAARAYKTNPTDSGTFSAFFLTARGYGALGRTDKKPTANAVPFESGMKARVAELADPPVETWNEVYQADLHAMLLIADDKEATVDAALQQASAQITATGGAVTLLGVERGRAMRNRDQHGIEHFGYVDGRSQPLMLTEDIAEEAAAGGIDQWDPTVPLGQVLVQDPGGSTPNSHGSYFVYRKLEQNVRGFKKDEQRLAAFLGLAEGVNDPAAAKDRNELAGAMVVGRFENGQPVALRSTDGDLAGKTVPNNFNFATDPQGLKCPLAGHIRKSNPRGESEAKFPQVPRGSEKGHLMARRGITYGRRSVDPNTEDLRFEDMPTGDVGLLFMAYQSSIGNQFEFTQRRWVNNPGFVGSGTGIDPVIGQTTQPSGQHWPDHWGESIAAQPFDFSHWVTLQGGEYFFAPSLSALKSF